MSYMYVTSKIMVSTVNRLQAIRVWREEKKGGEERGRKAASPGVSGASLRLPSALHKIIGTSLHSY